MMVISTDNTLRPFIGFGPVEDPKFVVLVVGWMTPKGSLYGSQIVAPVFKDIVSSV